MRMSDEPIEGRGEVVALKPSMHDVLVAYVAGPRHVQRVPREDSMVRERCGDEPWRVREPNDDDRAEIQDVLSGHMRAMGLPAPPPGDEWRVHLPLGVSRSDYVATLLDPEIPLFDDDNAAEVIEVLSRKLTDLLGSLDEDA
jgi:hypothetical protein